MGAIDRDDDFAATAELERSIIPTSVVLTLQLFSSSVAYSIANT